MSHQDTCLCSSLQQPCGSKSYQIQLSALQDLPPSKSRAIAHKPVAGPGLLNPPALLPFLGKDHCLSLSLSQLQGWDLACLVLSSPPHLQFYCPVEPGTCKSCSFCAPPVRSCADCLAVTHGRGRVLGSVITSKHLC